MMKIVKYILAITIASLVIGHAFASPKAKVIATDDFNQVGKLSRAKSVPILMVFSTTHCAYCEILEAEFLRPMLISGEYTNKVIIRKIVIDEVGSMRDFNGKQISSDVVMNRYNISVTPTILFLDGNGKELTKRLVGVGTVDFFGGFLDRAIDQSLKRLKQKQASLQASTQ